MTTAIRFFVAVVTISVTVPLVYYGYMIGGGIGAEAAERIGLPGFTVVGAVAGAVLLGAVCLLAPAAVAVGVDRLLPEAHHCEASTSRRLLNFASRSLSAP